MNCLFYPFFNECKYLYEYLSEDARYNIRHLVCPGACTYKVDAKYNVETDFDSALSDTDTVIISDITNMPWIYEDTAGKIADCLEKGFKVICCTSLEENELQRCRSIADENQFVYYGKACFENECALSSLRSINGIMIGIGMLSSGIECNSVFFGLLKRFREQGYTVAGICERYDSRLINGCYPFPMEIFSRNISDQQKILSLNDYINSIQMKHSADIVIICFPQAMLKYSDEVPDGFGVNAFMVSQAVSVDYFILNEPLLLSQRESMSELNNTFRERFGFEINAVGIDEKIVNYSDSKELEKIVYFKADPKAVADEVEKLRSLENGIIYFPVSDERFCENIVSDCIAELSGNVELF